MLANEMYPITKEPQPLGGNVEIDGTFQRPWGKLELTRGASRVYSLMPSCLPDEEQDPQQVCLPGQLWDTQVDVRLLSWEEAGSKPEPYTGQGAPPIRSKLGLHHHGITIGLYFQDDYDKALTDELEATMRGVLKVNPMVVSMLLAATDQTKIGLGFWREKMRQHELRRGRRVLGAVGMAAAGLAAGLGIARGYPVEGAMGSLALSVVDLAAIELAQTAGERRYDARQQSVNAQVATYTRAMQNDLYEIFTHRSRLL